MSASLADTINNDLKQAMKDKDQVKLRSLRAIKSAILLANTEKGAEGELTEEAEIKILQRLAKQRKDSLTTFQEQGREDLAKDEEEELAIIQTYLPTQLSTEEIEANVKEIISQVGAVTMKDMGKVMGAAAKELAGKADGKVISEVVKKLLG